MYSTCHRHLIFAAYVVFASCGVAVGAAPTTTERLSDEYVMRSWEVDGGLPGNSVTGIAQTPDGYLWVATQNGLARFDGARFTIYSHENTPGLETNRVRSVFAARNGDLWLGLDRGGVVRKHGDRFEVVVPILRDGKHSAWTNPFAEDAEGAIWYGWGAGRSVILWKNGLRKEFHVGLPGVATGENTFVKADADGKIWYWMRDSCGLFDGTAFQTIDAEGGDRVHLAMSRKGGMLATRGDQLVWYSPGGTRKDLANLTPCGGGTAVNFLLEDHAGDIWIATRGSGLFRWRNGAFVQVPTSHNDVLTLEEDREGNLWAGTRGGGLNQVRPLRFFLHKAEQGLVNDNVVSICQTTQGKLWLAPVRSPPVCSIDVGKRSFARLPGWVNPPEKWRVAAMCPDGTGGVWFACWTGRGLMHWHDGGFYQDNLRDPCTAVLQDHRGALWVATIHGPLILHRDGTDTPMPQENGLKEVRALAEDGRGSVWAGTDGGLVFRKMDDGFVPVPLQGALPPGSIRFIVPDGKETVWIAAYEGGIYRWRGGEVARLPHDVGLPSSDIRSLLIEPNGNFWIGTGQGLFFVARADIEAAVEGRRPQMNATSFGRGDGLPSTEFDFGFRNATARTGDGHLWFATYRGALEIIPQETLPNAAPLPLRIEEIQSGEMVLPTDSRQGFILPPRPGPLKIHFTLPQLGSPERLRFRYRLSGYWENEWVSTAGERTATFPRLPPGDYRFEVAASVANGPWLPTVSLPFQVRAAWWETDWIHLVEGLFGGLALIGVVRFFVRRRLNARMRMLEQENTLERERTRIARDIHDELGANLTQIAITSKLAKLDPANAVSGHIDEIATVARNTVESLDEIVWAINPRHDTLASLTEYIGKFTVNFLTASGIACKLDIPKYLPPSPLGSNLRHHLFLSVKEALNNIVKYADASEVRLEATYTGNLLRVVLADDGCGFEVGCEQDDANGLRNMRGRMEDVGGKCGIESRIGGGTRVIFELPLTEG